MTVKSKAEQDDLLNTAVSDLRCCVCHFPITVQEAWGYLNRPNGEPPLPPRHGASKCWDLVFARIATLEAALNGLEKLANKVAFTHPETNKHDEAMRTLRIHLRAMEAALSGTAEELCPTCGAYKRGEVCDHPANRYPEGVK